MNSAPPHQPFTINFVHEPEYLRAEVFGEQDSYQITALYWQKIAEELDKTGYKKLLVVEMLGENIEILDAIRAIRDRESRSFQGVKIAFFDMKQDHTATNSYGVAAAAHMGYDVEIFTDLHKAKDWLISE